MSLSFIMIVLSGGLAVIPPESTQPATGYQFRALADPNLLVRTIKTHVPALHERRRSYRETSGSGLYFARFRGSLVHLFGEPVQESTTADEAFDYIIEATTADGDTILLSAYMGASGPSIGIEHNHPRGQEAAEALFRLIDDTPPADFQASEYDSDTDHTVFYGCLNGSCYYKIKPGNHLDD